MAWTQNYQGVHEKLLRRELGRTTTKEFMKDYYGVSFKSKWLGRKTTKNVSLKIQEKKKILFLLFFEAFS